MRQEGDVEDVDSASGAAAAPSIKTAHKRRLDVLSKTDHKMLHRKFGHCALKGSLSWMPANVADMI